MAKKYPKKYSKEVQDLLKGICDDLLREDQSVRYRQIRTWRKLKLLWENFRSTYFDDVAHDWRIPPAINANLSNDQAYYDKQMNVYRAYLESIIAALSVLVPKIKCVPDDAESALDLSTAKAGDKIAKLIYRHNEVELLWLHALFTFCTEGMVACYNYSDSDKEYGTFVEPVYEEVLENHQTITCPECGFQIDDDILPEGEEGIDGVIGEQEMCPACGMLINPQMNAASVSVSQLIREEMKNKTRQCLEAYGGLNVQIPNWARCQEEVNYLQYSYETHYSNALEYYPDLYGEINPGVFDPYESWGRLSPQYMGEYPIHNVTCRHIWLRPAAFNCAGTEREMNHLKQLFPNGVRIDMVNDTFAGCETAELDKDWTITHNPMANYVHFDPLGLLLVSVQEITNDLISLGVQTVEHGIGQTFADPGVLNFKGYKQMETMPGAIYPATPKAGKSLADGFYEIKTATLSQEVMPFGQQVQALGQTVSGALPSLFGGALQEQKTASGYAMSRDQALQRLQNVWKMFTMWWVNIFSKAIPRYIEECQYDERDVQRNLDGSFVNVWIRKAELEGKIGRFELEGNENLPMTWSQKKDTIMQLLQMNNPVILEYLGTPENLSLLREAIGLDDFFIPGEDDKNAEYEEIQAMLNSTPMPGGIDMMGQPFEVSSVDIDPELDNHQIRFEIDRQWIISEAGRLAKQENPNGYQNILLHAKAHLAMIQQAQMAQMQAEAEMNNKNAGPDKGAENPEKPKETDKKAPIEGAGDVITQ